MQQSYTNNYLKIYGLQGVSVILGLASLLVVTPFISANKDVFGIYSIVMSLNVFLIYSDFGFVGSGMKFAAESLAKNDRSKESKILGFTILVLLIFVILFSVVLMVIRENSALLFRELSKPNKIMAENLLLITVCFSPVSVLQRISQFVFKIRLEEYVLQFFNILGSLIKIASVFYFFSGDEYNIIEYYLFFNLVSLLIALISIVVGISRFKYNVLSLLRNVYPSKEIYLETSSLAYASFLSTISWVLFYEMDAFYIASKFGADKVAIFSISATFLSLIRTYLGVFFTPFAARYNHFIGTNDLAGLAKFFNHIVGISMPVVVFPLLGLIFLAEPIIYGWVGHEFSGSVYLAQLFVACNFFGFLSYPVSMLIVALNRTRIISGIAWLLPVMYWTLIFFSIDLYGLNIFGYAKLGMFLLIFGFYFYFIVQKVKWFSLKLFLNLTAKWIPSALLFCLLLIVWIKISHILNVSGAFTNIIAYIILNLIALLLGLIFDSNWNAYVSKVGGYLSEKLR